MCRKEGHPPLAVRSRAPPATKRRRQQNYDNPRTIVLAKDEASGHVEWNATFKDRMDLYGVMVWLCWFYCA